MPDFWLAIMLLIVFSMNLGWFPSGGTQSLTPTSPASRTSSTSLNHLFLPVVTLTLAYLGEYYLLMRSSLLDVLGEEYVDLAAPRDSARSTCCGSTRSRTRLLPTMTLIALNFGFVLGGAITVETVFSYPGLGLLTFDALQSQDFALLQGMFLFFSARDPARTSSPTCCTLYLDPRVREA